MDTKGAKGMTMRPLLILSDDSCVYLYDHADAVVVDIEALDAESCILSACDVDGVPHRIEWVEPNRSTKVFGLFKWVTNGSYRLVPDGPPDSEAPNRLLERAGQLVVRGNSPGLAMVAERLRAARRSN